MNFKLKTYRQEAIDKARKSWRPLIMNIEFRGLLGDSKLRSLFLSYKENEFSSNHYFIFSFRLYCYQNEKMLTKRILKIRQDSFGSIAEFNDNSEFSIALFTKMLQDDFNMDRQTVNGCMKNILSEEEIKELCLVLLSEILNLEI